VELWVWGLNSNFGYNVLRQGFLASVYFLKPNCSLSFDGNKTYKIMMFGLLSDQFFCIWFSKWHISDVHPILICYHISFITLHFWIWQNLLSYFHELVLNYLLKWTMLLVNNKVKFFCDSQCQVLSVKVFVKPNLQSNIEVLSKWKANK
jgi:hypothetical protein